MAEKHECQTTPSPGDFVERRVLPDASIFHEKPQAQVYNLSAIPRRGAAEAPVAVVAEAIKPAQIAPVVKAGTVTEPKKPASGWIFGRRRRAEAELGMFAERLARLN